MDIIKKIEFYEISDFLYHLQIDKRLSQNTLKSYATDLNQYAVFLKKYQKIDNVTQIMTLHINKYIISMKNKDLSKQTIVRKLTVIKEFHKFMTYEKIVDENVSLTVTGPKLDQNLPDVLTVEEVETLINFIDVSDPIGIRNKAMVELLYASGLRVSELLDLKLSNIHLNAKYIDVIGKGNKERIVPIGDEAVLALRNYIENARNKISIKPGSILFYSYQGSKMSRQAFHKYIVNLAKDCGILKDVSPHTIRHSFATHLLEGGIDLLTVQKMLGHEDISTTQIYTHIDKTKLKRMYLQTHPLARKDKNK